jgi:hypothetical protein
VQIAEREKEPNFSVPQLTMTLLIISIPIMALAVAIAVVPLVVVSHAEHKVRRRTEAAEEHAGARSHVASAEHGQLDESMSGVLVETS